MLLNTCYRLCKGYEQYRKMSNKEDVDTEPKAEIESDTKPEDNVAGPEDTEKVEGDDDVRKKQEHDKLINNDVPTLANKMKAM